MLTTLEHHKEVMEEELVSPKKKNEDPLVNNRISLRLQEKRFGHNPEHHIVVMEESTLCQRLKRKKEDHLSKHQNIE